MKSLLSEQGQVLFGDEPNSILIVDYPENIERVEEYLQMVDTKPRQVHIEARVVEVKLQGETSLGIDWTLFATTGGWNFGNFDMYSGTAAQGIRTTGVIDYDTFSKIKDPPISGSTANTDPFTLTLSHNNIDVVMKALANDYDTDILSAPSVTTINNHEAVIQMTDIYPWAEPTVTTVQGADPEISYEMNFEEAGIILSVTPTISEDGDIIMDLQPEISEKTDDYDVTIDPGGGSQSVTYTVPIIETRQARTRVVVGSGDTLIIGGLIKNKEIESELKIPLLGDIPYLGYLFKTTRKTMDKRELVIFVSPTIMKEPEIAYAGELERKIRKDIEGEESKIEMVPLKEVGPLKRQKEETLAAQEREKEEALAAKKKRKEQALARKAQGLYNKAVSLYADGRVEAAKQVFEKVLRYDPDHNGALRFLETKIPEALREKRAELEQPELIREVKAKPVVRQESRTEALDQEELVREREAEVTRREQEAEAARRKQEAKARLEEKRQKEVLENQAKELYSQALSLYRKKRYNKAYNKFQQVQAVVAGYARSQSYLDRIPGLIEAQQKKREAEAEAARRKEAELKASNLYKQALSLYNQKQYSQALGKFQELEAFSPGYRHSERYLAKIPGLIEKERQERRAREVREKEQAIENQAKETYRVALSLYQVKKYKEAYAKFEAVQKLMPGYRETSYYLNKIPAILERKQRAEQIRYKKDREQAIQEMLNACD